MYVHGRIYFHAPWLYVRVHATCAPLLRHMPFLTRPRFIAVACRQTDRPVCTYTFVTRMTTLRTLRPSGSQLSGGKRFFHEIWWPVRWVPAVRWRNHYFPRNKEALPCYGHGPSCQPLHVQYSSDGNRSLTTLTTPRREHQGGGRWRGLGRGHRGAGEDATVDAHVERSTRVHWFGCGVRLLLPQNNRGCR